MKKSILLTITILFLSIIMIGCSDDGDSNGSSDSPSEITYASTEDAPGLSPIDTNDSVTSDVTIQIYETLFVLNPETTEVEMLLAESYETPDENTWEIKLKEDIEFHDGTPFNAEAVKYTFDQIKDPERAAPRASLLAPIDSIEVKDEYTVTINTTEPYGPMLAALSHTNAAIVSPTADEEGDLNQNPVGTGPFVFDNWVQGDEIVLTKNENYWQEPAKLDKVTYKVVPEESTAISMLETGEVDFLVNVASDHINRVNSLNGIEVEISEGARVSYLGFHMEKEPFNEIEFRKAVAHGVNQEAYVNQLNELGNHNESIVGPSLFGYNEEDQNHSYSYDPDKASEIIEENGYDEEEYTILVADRENYLKMAEIVQSQLSEVGLDINIESIEWGTFLDTVREGDYEMTFLGWSNSTADGSELLYPNLHSDNIGSTNYSQYNNEEFDSYVDESRRSVEQDERAEAISKANIIAIEDAPWIVMEHNNVTVAYNEDVEGLVISPTSDWRLYEVTKN